MQRRDAQDGWFARWRTRRRAKRQQTLERRYVEHERTRSYEGGLARTIDRANASSYASSYATASVGFWDCCGGGDGGGA